MPPSTRRTSPVMKRASSEARNRAAWAVSQPVPILPRSRTWASRSAQASAVGRPVARAMPAGDGHRRVHEAHHDRIGPDAVACVRLGDARRQAIDRCLGYLVRHLRRTGHCRERRDVDDRSALLLSHRGDGGFDCQPHALQVHRHDAVEDILLQPVGRRIAAAADADGIEQDVQPTVARACLGDVAGAVRRDHDVGGHRGGRGGIAPPTRTPFTGDHVGRLARPPRPIRSTQSTVAPSRASSRAVALAVADGLSFGLPGADDDGDLPFDAIGHLTIPSGPATR